MMKMPELNRHAVGIPALVLLIAGLGVVGGIGPGNLWRPVQRAAQNAENSMRIASVEQQQPLARNAWDQKFIGDTGGGAPVIEHRSASADNSANQGAAQAQQNEPANMGATGGATQASDKSEDLHALAATALKDWSEADWRIATQAVNERRGASATQSSNKAAEQQNAPGGAVEHRSAAQGDKSAPQGGDKSAAQGDKPATQGQFNWKPPAEIAGKKASTR